MRLPITLLFITLISYCASGQILNVEKFRLDADTSNAILGNIGMTYSFKKQKTNVSRYGGDASVVYLSEKHSYMLLSNLALVNVAESDVVSEGYAHLRLNFFRRNKISIEQFNQIQYDVGRGLSQRALSGVGLRWQAVKSKKMELAIGSGAMFEHEVWSGDTNQITNDFVKSSTVINCNISLAKNVSFLGIAYYQARKYGILNPRITLDTTLLISISKKFSFKNQFTMTYDAAPVIQAGELIYALESGINYQF